MQGLVHVLDVVDDGAAAADMRQGLALYSCIASMRRSMSGSLKVSVVALGHHVKEDRAIKLLVEHVVRLHQLAVLAEVAHPARIDVDLRRTESGGRNQDEQDRRGNPAMAEQPAGSPTRNLVRRSASECTRSVRRLAR